MPRMPKIISRERNVVKSQIENPEIQKTEKEQAKIYSM